MRAVSVLSIHQQQRLSWREKLSFYAIGLALTLSLCLLSVLQPRALQKADFALYDLMLAQRSRPPQSGAPVLVGIDEPSLSVWGQWPWPRYRLARLIETLQGLGAEVVVLDFLMPEFDRTAPEVIERERLHEHLRTSSVAALPPPASDSNSERLADALGQGKTVLGYYLDFLQPTTSVRQTEQPTVPAGMVVTRSAPAASSQWPHPQGQIRSLPILTRAASAEGFTNATKDSDGVLRRVPLLLPSPQGQGPQLPSLALSALLLTSPQRTLQVVGDEAETHLRWQQRAIPLDKSGHMLIDWRSQLPTYWSASQVLEGKVAPNSLRGKVVLVGAWAQGLGDLHLTPSGQSMYGLAVHATVIDNIVSGTFITRPFWAPGAELLATLLVGLLCTWWLARAGFVASASVVVLATAACYGGARQLLVVQGIHLSPLVPMLTLVVLTSFLSLFKYGMEAHKLRRRTQDLLKAQDGIILSLSVLSEARDKETGGHILRTQRYVELLAQHLATTPAYAHLSPADIELLAKSAPLHDIGKVGIADSILQKPGKLTAEEFDTMKTHPLIGAEAMRKIMASTSQPGEQSFLNYACEMIESHHERWDGTGYPHRLRGPDIPLAGRLMALADVYDALVSKRVYKASISHDDVRQMIVKDSGTHFDPDVVAAFLAQEAAFLQISQQYADPPEEAAQVLSPA